MANHPQGYMTLITMLIVGAIATAITTTVIILGLGSSQNAQVKIDAAKAIGLANACAEEALQRIREQEGFNGEGQFTLDGNTCEFTVSDLGGESRQILVSASVNETVKKVRLEISQISPQLQIESWQEVANF